MSRKKRHQPKANVFGTLKSRVLRWVKRFILALLALIVFVVLLAVLDTIALSIWLRGAYVRTTLPSEYLPTAEYLMQHPQPTPEYLGLNPNPGSITKLINEICVNYDFTILFSEWSYVRINKQQIRSNDTQTSSYGTLEYSRVQMCFHLSEDEVLSPGLHLIEFQLRSTPFDTRFPIYEWAIEVEG